MSKMHIKFNVSPEAFLADLTQAAYQVILKAGFDIPFIKMELGLQSALREVIRKDMLVSGKLKDTEGNSPANQIKPWSMGANSIFEKIEAKYSMLGFGQSTNIIEK